MKTRLVPILTFAALAGAASAQLTGIKVSAGYGFTGGITDSGGTSRTMSGPELTASFPFQHLPVLDLGVEYDVLFGGSGNTSIEGTLHRFLFVARMSVPGSNVSAWWGVGYGTAQGHNGDFATVSGSLTQLGVSIPLGTKTPAFVPTLELAGTFAGHSALGGFMFGLGLKF